MATFFIPWFPDSKLFALSGSSRIVEHNSLTVVVPFFVRELQNNFSHPLYKETAASVSVFLFPTTLWVPFITIWSLLDDHRKNDQSSFASPWWCLGVWYLSEGLARNSELETVVHPRYNVEMRISGCWSGDVAGDAPGEMGDAGSTSDPG